MGRMTDEKGFDMLLKAWAIVESRNTDWTLEIVGEGPLEASLKELHAKLGLKRVVFSPFTSNPEKKYREASIYVMSSRHEGFPLVLLEAANMSLPIVSFDCNNGPREIVHDGVNGFLVAPGDINAMAGKILELIDSEDERLTISENALLTMKAFRMENVILEWKRLIASLTTTC